MRRSPTTTRRIAQSSQETDSEVSSCETHLVRARTSQPIIFRSFEELLKSEQSASRTLTVSATFTGLPVTLNQLTTGEGLQWSGRGSHNLFSLSHALTTWMNSAGRSMLGE